MENNLMVEKFNDVSVLSMEELSILQGRVVNAQISNLVNKVKEISDGMGKLQTEIEILTNANNTIKDELEAAKVTIENIDERTNTIEHEDTKTFKELKRVANSKVMTLTGGKSTPKYELFYRTYIMDLYKIVSDALAYGKSIGKIKVADGMAAISIANRYYPSKRVTEKRLQNLIEKDSKGILTEVQKKSLDLYLSEINGGI